MYKLTTFFVLLFGLALAPVLSGGVEDKRDDFKQSVGQPEQDAHSEQDNSPSASNYAKYADYADHAGADKARACEWQCQACASDEGCSQTCVEIGDCGSTCSVVAQCDATHVWDEGSCACLPRPA
ncbi:hypothetical protein ENSA5_59960 [Enhygromyxa salina]|uniref:Uncharacterized protein n=1 Tax=Enhygromyxa salina TaxID=215803 RepID=A0A2S9XE07_9BACT|nr:hypothetical protein [Enhygromyxa salina]PRP90921.1 hypothetical protein ENSA5_59960 [Enhygromyxa salina]